MRQILLLRHGTTKGNLERRYVGRTDEPLTKECRERFFLFGRAKSGFYSRLGRVEAVYMSPMKRCAESAELLFPAKKFPDTERIFVPEFAECDFGTFEYKNYEELCRDTDYQRFLDTNGESGFPGGETAAGFKERCAKKFAELLFGRRDDILETNRAPVTAELTGAGSAPGVNRAIVSDFDAVSTLVFLVHGGTIMSVLSAFACPGADYYSWQTENGCGFLCRAGWEQNAPVLTEVAKIRVL